MFPGDSPYLSSMDPDGAGGEACLAIFREEVTSFREGVTSRSSRSTLDLASRLSSLLLEVESEEKTLQINC